MIVYEFKFKEKDKQYQALDEAIRTSQFIQNKCLRYWIDNPLIASALCTGLDCLPLLGNGNSSD